MKRYLIFLGCVIFLLGGLFPSQHLREIEDRLPGSTGTIRIKLLTELTHAYQEIEPKKAVTYGEEAIKLLRTLPDPSLEAILLNHLSTANIWLGDYTTSGKYAFKSRAIAQKTGDKQEEANALYNIAWTYWNQGHYIKAEEGNSQCFNLYNQLGHREGLAKSFQLTGMIAWKRGDFAHALESVFKATKTYEALGDEKGIAVAKNMSGIIASEAGEYPEGLTFFFEANRIYNKIGDHTGVARTLNNIGRSYSKIGNLSDALKFNKESLALSQELGIKSLAANTIINIGEIYFQMKEYPAALEHFTRALHIKESINEPMWVSYILINIGKIQRTLGKYREAVHTLENALEIARKIKIKNEIKNASKELSEIFVTLGDYQKALAHYEEYLDMEGIIFNEKSQKKMVELNLLHETDKQAKEITLLGKNRELQQLQIDQQTRIRNSLYILVILVLFLALAFYQRYRLKDRTAKTLSQEVREHKQTAQKLRESEEKFRTLAEKSAVGICIIQDSVIRYANPAFLSLFGFTREEILGHSPVKLPVEEDKTKVMEKWGQALTRKPIPSPGSPASPDPDFTHLEFKGLTGSGHTLYLESYSARTLYQGQAAILAVIIDITGRKKTETELLKMRKLESVGILAGTIAHDFNYFLTHITDDAEKLAEEVQQHPHLSKLADGIQKTSLKAAELAQKLITFSGGGGAAVGEVALASVLNSTINAFPTVPKPVREISLHPQLTSVYGNEEELGQVFGNLLWNAQEAKINGKNIEITITAENTSLPPGNNAGLKPGKYIKVHVTDNGKGIPAEQMDNVFDPYYSTKDTFHQKGMGLGLAICYSIVKKHNGHISIKSEKGKGTAVELLLPAYNNNHHL